MNLGLYILKDKLAIPCDSMKEWGRFMETGDRRVAETMIENVWVSTVFLGLDHNHFGGEPLLFETMVFLKEEGCLNSSDVEPMIRTSCWGSAELAHKMTVKRMVEKLEKAQKAAEGLLYAAITMEEVDPS